jgi:glycine betaine/choline ABC-type transport system substrate-binding protein
MARLNRQVDLGKKDPVAVARAFLKQEGLIK